MKIATNYYIVDTRWNGTHGIGRFSKEVISRLGNVVKYIDSPKNPLGLLSTIFLPFQLIKKKAVFFTPGFNAPLYSSIPFVFVLHDLTHLKINGFSYTNIIRKIYYDFVIKRAAKKAFKILTVSNTSKKEILHWTKLSEDRVIVVGDGVGDSFSSEGENHNAGFPYIFCLGNFKTHKNIIRAIQAFAAAKIESKYKLLIAGNENPQLRKLITSLNIADRVVFNGVTSENELPSYYRGASAFLFPSLSEGFGLPIIEAMACGTPVITSNISAMPEVSGNAALLVDPYDVNSISLAIENIIENTQLKNDLIVQGLINAKRFTRDKTAKIINEVLHEALKLI